VELKFVESYSLETKSNHFNRTWWN